MGRLNEEWQQDFIAALQDKGIKVTPCVEEGIDLLLLSSDKGSSPQVAVNLISLTNYKDFAADFATIAAVEPAGLLNLQSAYQKKEGYLVQLWQDIWQSKREQVLGRIDSILGFNKKLHGRKGVITAINQQEADDFLLKNHLQGSARVKFKFALKIDGEMVAVALFSARRPMNLIAQGYYSYELVRFASLIGFTVTGGFSKLLKHFIQLVQPNDIMSYADRDWSLGHAYEQSGFKLVEETAPLEILVHNQDLIRYFPHRLPADADITDYFRIFNTGNLKYILYL